MQSLRIPIGNGLRFRLRSRRPLRAPFLRRFQRLLREASANAVPARALGRRPAQAVEAALAGLHVYTVHRSKRRHHAKEESEEGAEAREKDGREEDAREEVTTAPAERRPQRCEAGEIYPRPRTRPTPIRPTRRSREPLSRRIWAGTRGNAEPAYRPRIAGGCSS